MDEVEQLKIENADLKEKSASYEKQIGELTVEKVAILNRLAEKDKFIESFARKHEELLRLLS